MKYLVTQPETLQILFEGKRAVGVRFVRDGGDMYDVFAKKEVIVSASAINSPHLLMLSGIGREKELVKHGVSRLPLLWHLIGCDV